MSFTTAFKKMDVDLVRTFGELCLYESIKTPGESVELYAVIDYEISFYTQLTDIGSGGVVITAQVNNMPAPCNADRITDNDGNRWKILKIIENDGSIISVSAVRDPRASELI